MDRKKTIKLLSPRPPAPGDLPNVFTKGSARSPGLAVSKSSYSSIKFSAVPPKDFSRYPGLAVFNSPCSLRNRNLYTTSTTTKKPQKKPKITIYDNVTSHYPPAPTLFPPLQTILPSNTLALQSPTPHIY